MKIKRIGVGAAAIATAAALALTGCSNSGSGGDNSEVKKNVTLTVAQNQPISSYNGTSINGNSTYNSNILAMTESAFNYYNDKSELVKNTKFGTYKVVTEDPLTVKYTINKGVKWSDGTQVGAADLLLAWAAGQVKYNGGEDGKGAVNFSSATAGTLDKVSKVPEISNDDRSVTLVYDTPYVDWETNFEPTAIPAQAAYAAAFPGTKASDADAAVIKAIQDGDETTLKALATAWSTKFDLSGDLPSDKSIYLSDGAYIISDLKKDQYVTLTRNKDYTWGPKPKANKITVRFITDPTAQVQALQNGEIDITYSQADEDTVAALKKLKGVTTETDSAATYEHVDLTFNNKGPFDPATYGGDEEKAKDVREAFLKVLPRQQIVDNLIKPIQSDAKLDESQTYLPGFDGYDESVAGNGSSAYDKTDVDGAKALLKQAGVTGTVDVKLLYAKSNPRRAAEYALIKAEAKKAGFNVVDNGNDDWSSLLGNGSYDAALFAWAASSTAATANEALFTTGGGNNVNGYSNKTVDADYKTLDSTFDTAKQNKLLADIDKQVWGDAYGVTLFQFPDVTAWSKDVKGVSYAPLVPNVFWDYWNWTK